MKLDVYLTQVNRRPAAFARDIGVHTSMLYRILSGERKASLGVALRIERQTGGAVKPGDLVHTREAAE